jgi:hypothetical protein
VSPHCDNFHCPGKMVPDLCRYISRRTQFRSVAAKGRGPFYRRGDHSWSAILVGLGQVGFPDHAGIVGRDPQVRPLAEPLSMLPNRFRSKVNHGRRRHLPQQIFALQGPIFGLSVSNKPASKRPPWASVTAGCAISSKLVRETVSPDSVSCQIDGFARAPPAHHCD